MNPSKTTYRLMTQKDRKHCRSLMQKAAFEFRTDLLRSRLGFPTVVADRAGVLLGFISTVPSNTEIVAGPLVIDPAIKNRGPTALHLLEAYDNLMRAAGVVEYLFWVDEANTYWLKILAKLDLTHYATNNDQLWFKRPLWTAAVA